MSARSSTLSPVATPRRRASSSPRTSPPCCRILRTKDVSPVTPRIDPPLALLVELTHRCPLRCPYCSNPVALERAASELAEQEWLRVLRQAAALGVLQVHFSGGEPMARPELGALIAAANERGLYNKLI